MPFASRFPSYDDMSHAVAPGNCLSSGCETLLGSSLETRAIQLVLHIASMVCQDLERWAFLLGTFHAFKGKYLQAYVNECSYRFDRRNFQSERGVQDMVKIHLSRILGERRMTQRRLAELTGLRPNTVNELYNERAKRIDFTTIDRLCQALQCQVGELIEHVPSIEDNDSVHRK